MKRVVSSCLRSFHQDRSRPWLVSYHCRGLISLAGSHVGYTELTQSSVLSKCLTRMWASVCFLRSTSHASHTPTCPGFLSFSLSLSLFSFCLAENLEEEEEEEKRKKASDWLQYVKSAADGLRNITLSMASVGGLCKSWFSSVVEGVVASTGYTDLHIFSLSVPWQRTDAKIIVSSAENPKINRSTHLISLG